jgi:hypothetical protein
MPAMRAKMRLHHIVPYRDSEGCTIQEQLHFHAVAASKYPEDGSDENNTYAKFSPSGRLELTVANPALVGRFETGKEYYLDFTPVS